MENISSNLRTIKRLKEKEMLKSYKDKHSVYPVANQRR